MDRCACALKAEDLANAMSSGCVILLCLFTVIAVVILPETKGKNLSEI